MTYEDETLVAFGDDTPAEDPPMTGLVGDVQAEDIG